MPETIILHGQPVTRETMRRLKQVYQKAEAEGAKSFLFGSQVVLVSYAKYLVEYAEQEFGGPL